MNTGATPGDEPLGIVDVAAVCGHERARALALFERLGGWVTSTTDPALQRLFATAAHQHAWHAELWTERAPTIPVPDHTDSVAAIVEADGDDDRWAAYVTALGLLRVELAALRARVDAELDPSTTRVIDLVGADADRLAVLVTDNPPS